MDYGGETGIRTLDRVSPIHAFQACAFSHSAISPLKRQYRYCISRMRADCLLTIGYWMKISSAQNWQYAITKRQYPISPTLPLF